MNVVTPANTGDSSSRGGDVDLWSEGRLLELLTAIRNSHMDESVKMDLRDLVLTFSHTKDPQEKQATQAEILSTLKTYVSDVGPIVTDAVPQVAAEAEAPAVEPAAPEVAGLGQSRPQPQFAATAPTAPVPKVEAAPAAEVKPAAAEPTPDPAVNSVPITKITDAPTPAPNQPTEVPVPQPEVATPPVQNPTPAVETPVQADVAQVAEPEPAPVSTPDPLPADASGQAMARIKEIKKSVNERVGNPINLIDRDNTIGREYMNSLLEAMKKTSGAPAGELASAMQRLEAAFSAVDAMLSGTAPEVPQTTAAATSQPAEVSTPTPAATQPAPSAPVPAAPVTEPEPVAVTAPSVPEPTPVEPAATTPGSEVQNVAPSAEVKPTEPAPATPSAPATTTPAEAVAPVKKASRLRSLASTLATVPYADGGTPSETSTPAAPAATPAQPAAPAVATDPLHSPEINAGLDQLLSEWKLFKSSGIFGMGASGTDHPLYKQLSQLPMASVVGGRFEGATPEIKQSITDYMNGWRYEQQIVHELQETFEHYLRRVIKKVLSVQPKTPAV